MLQHARQRVPRSRAGFHRDFNSANRLDRFATSDAKHARFETEGNPLAGSTPETRPAASATLRHALFAARNA